MTAHVEVDDDDILRPVAIRMKHRLKALMDEAAAVSGAQNVSEWARAVLEEAGMRDIIAASRLRTQTTVTGAQVTVLGMRREPPKCVHPGPARTKTLLHEVCTACGAVLRLL